MVRCWKSTVFLILSVQCYFLQWTVCKIGSGASARIWLDLRQQTVARIVIDVWTYSLVMSFPTPWWVTRCLQTCLLNFACGPLPPLRTHLAFYSESSFKYNTRVKFFFVYFFFFISVCRMWKQKHKWFLQIVNLCILQRRQINMPVRGCSSARKQERSNWERRLSAVQFMSPSR